MNDMDKDIERCRDAVLSAQNDEQLTDAIGVSSLSSEGYWASIVWVIMRDELDAARMARTRLATLARRAR